MSEYSFYDFKSFVEKLPESINEETARNIINVTNRIYPSIEDKSIDVREIDFEVVLRKFSDSLNKPLSESAIKAYKGRLNSGLKKFVYFIETGLINVKRNKVKNTEFKTKPSLNTFSLPILLRNGHILEIKNLPIDLTQDEATRIANVINSYAVND